VAVTALIFAKAKDTNYIFVDTSFVQFYSNRRVDMKGTGKKITSLCDIRPLLLWTPRNSQLLTDITWRLRVPNFAQIYRELCKVRVGIHLRP